VRARQGRGRLAGLASTNVSAGSSGRSRPAYKMPGCPCSACSIGSAAKHDRSAGGRHGARSRSWPNGCWPCLGGIGGRPPPQPQKPAAVLP